MNNHRSVVVVGAGISGLTCAYRLKSLGADVLLIEKSDSPGGVIKSEVIDGYLIERGPSSSQGTEELIAFIDELGISDQLVEGDPKAPAFVYFGGRLHAVPNSLGTFINTHLLSARGKVRVITEPFVSRRVADDEESVGEFAARRVGHEFADRIVAPFVSGIYAGNERLLSVRAAFPRLFNLENTYGGLVRGALAKMEEARKVRKRTGKKPKRRRLCSFQRGMQFLPQTLAARLGEDFISGCSVREIIRAREGTDKSEHGFIVRFDSSIGIQDVSCDHLVAAAPARTAARLLLPLSGELSALLDEIEYPPVSVVSLAYDASAIRTSVRGFGFLAAPSEQLRILGCVFTSSLFPGRAPAERVLLTVFMGGVRNPSIALLPDGELVAVAHSELQKVLGITSDPHVVAISRHERAIPQYNLGHAARVRRIEELLSKMPGVYLVGNYLHGVSTGDCIREGERVAKLVASAL